MESSTTNKLCKKNGVNNIDPEKILEFKSIINKMSDEEINNALFGFILGDGNYSGWRIDIRHTTPQFFYCDWIAEIFERRLREKRNFFSQTNSFGCYDYSQICLTVPDGSIRNKNYFFNSDGKKIVSDYVLNNISVLGLLFWYLDDGSLYASVESDGRSKRFAYFCTQGFTYEENEKIQNMFKIRFGIDTRIHIDRSYVGGEHKQYYKLYLSATSFRKFFDLERSYLKFIPNEFKYKFNMKYEVNRLKTSADFVKLYNIA